MTMPLVTVFTPTYNGAEFVAETIESVLVQTYEPIEHILIDDASTDETPEILHDYAHRFPDRIRVLAHRERLGPCRRRREAIELARGDLLAWLDHDDIWLPTKVERQVDAFLEDPRVGFSYTQFETFDSETGHTLERPQTDAQGDVLRVLFTVGVYVGSSTAMFRRAALETRRLRLRDTDFSFGDDYFLWLALSLDWRAALVDEVLARFRRHSGNESARLGRENTYPASVALLEEFVDMFPDAATKLGPARRLGIGHHWAAAAAYERQRGRTVAALGYGLRSARHDPAGAARWTAGAARRAPSSLRRRLARV
jgi:glycosyltransferase involved in cell wall biosynthesis